MTQAPVEEPEPQELLLKMLTGKWVSQAISVAASLGVADCLAEGPVAAEKIAEQTKANPDALYRLLRALASVGVFTETSDRAFANTALSKLLRDGVQGSQRGMARFIGMESTWDPWGRLEHSVRTGDAAFKHFYGMNPFDYFGEHPDQGAIFNDAMTGFSAFTARAVAEAYDFLGIGTLVDIGGGHGALLAAILEANPDLRGILFDLPEVIEGAEEQLGGNPSGERIEIRAGSFFDGVPGGGGAYIMKHIIHDWDDERSVQILSNCRKALAAGGKVLVVDHVVVDGPEADLAKLLDLEMLVMAPGGRERTAAEFAALFEKSGLHLERILPTASP
ncbi:acetylserotonin O-methyltransferase, partial [Acidobacteria bacterium AH-259-O06]|nr:acetylserotonin O-methyltransferase [Acidobacteria bacterium AH-259-O06]